MIQLHWDGLSLAEDVALMVLGGGEDGRMMERRRKWRRVMDEDKRERGREAGRKGGREEMKGEREVW